MKMSFLPQGGHNLNWVRQKSHSNDLNMIMSHMRRGVKICLPESMATQGWEGQMRLSGEEELELDLEEGLGT